MDIKSRILSRKVVFVYFYQKYFMEEIWNNELFFEDILEIEKIINYKSITKEALSELKNNIVNLYDSSNYESDVLYIKYNFFEYNKSTLDFEYIDLMINSYDKYKTDVENIVNDHVDSFKYQEMDMIDKTIFLLWYIENNEIGTPKQVILNEMINIAKKYWDNSSYKLINWIGHKII